MTSPSSIGHVLLVQVIRTIMIAVPAGLAAAGAFEVLMKWQNRRVKNLRAKYARVALALDSGDGAQ